MFDLNSTRNVRLRGCQRKGKIGRGGSATEGDGRRQKKKDAESALQSQMQAQRDAKQSVDVLCSCIPQFVFLNVAQVSFSGVSEMKRVMPSEGEANQ